MEGEREMGKEERMSKRKEMRGVKEKTRYKERGKRNSQRPGAELRERLVGTAHQKGK